MSVLSTLLNIKASLPLNGDWLYPTLTTTKNKADERDLASIYNNVESVLKDLPLHPLNDDEYSLLLKEVDRYTNTMWSRSDHIRDKAKTLLGLAAFAGAVAVGTFTILSSRMLSIPSWAIIAWLVLVCLFILQFSLSLIRLTSTITREEAIEISPQTLLRIFNKQSTPAWDYKKQLISERLALANQNHQLITTRANKLILGQTGVIYGLSYGFAMLLCVPLILLNTQSESKPLDQTVPELLQEIRTEIRNMAHVAEIENGKAITASTSDFQALLTEVKALSNNLKQIEQRIPTTLVLDQKGHSSKKKHSPNSPN